MSRAAKISRVLVAVDFDDASLSALSMAGALAAAWDAEITLLHSTTLDVPAYFTGAQIVALEAERERSRAAIRTRLRAFAGQHVPHAAQVIVEEGPPQDILIRMATGFDLIVVGTHRRRGVPRWWLGSVAEAVVRRSRRPVFVVPAGAAVPEVRRPSILAAGGDAAAVDKWVDALRIAFGGDVVRSPDVHHCAPDHLHSTDLIVLSLPAAGDSHFGAIVQVLKACVHPVLFVPSTEGTFERSPS